MVSTLQYFGEQKNKSLTAMWGFFNVNALCIAFIYFIHHWLTSTMSVIHQIRGADWISI
jgi:hypothetical protein